MNGLKNKVQLIGNLGADPEIKLTEKGRKYARFSIATNESYKAADGEIKKETQWHNVIVWGPKAESIEKLLKKGSEVAMQGKLTHNQWEDKEGNKRYSTSVVLSEFMLLNRADMPF